MNFEDEEYVRVYCRDTPTTDRLGWEGRTVLWHLERVMPKSGVLEFDEGDDLVEIVASLCKLPEELTKVGLERLASRGVTRRHAASIEIVKFVEAQNAKRSDRLRAQDYRDRQKAEALIFAGNHPLASRGVTARHDSSLPASPPLPSPGPALPGLTKDPGPLLVSNQDSGTFEKADPAPRDIAALSAAYLRDECMGSMGGIGGGVANQWPEVLAVCAALQRAFGRPVALRPIGLKDPRLRVILERFSDGFSQVELERAISGSKFADYIANNQAHQTLQTILRDPGQVEKFGALTQPAVLVRQQAVEPRDEARELNRAYDRRQDSRFEAQMERDRAIHEAAKARRVVQ